MYDNEVFLTEQKIIDNLLIDTCAPPDESQKRVRKKRIAGEPIPFTPHTMEPYTFHILNNFPQHLNKGIRNQTLVTTLL